MIKQMVKLEHKIGDRAYYLFCDSDSPTIEIKEALSKFTAVVVNVEEKAKETAQQENKKDEDEVITPTEVM